MKTKAIAVFSTALLISGALVSSASAQVDVVTISANAGVNVESQGNATNGEAKTTVRGNATSTTAKSSTTGNATSTGAKVGGQLNAELHRNTVATFVQSLLAVANREVGIGAQVRAIAMSQNNSASTSANAIVKVENRGAIRTFFLGSDYKNLGQLRSEMATTSANITKLQNLLAEATSAVAKAELSAQIQVLVNSQAQIETFVEAHESSFSLFGWFSKRFAQ